MKQPNLTYIFADQLRHDVFGFVGDDKAITPNIDRFASESVHFSNATCVSSVRAVSRVPVHREVHVLDRHGD